MNTYQPTDNVVHLHAALRTEQLTLWTQDEGSSSAIELAFRATASSAPDELAARLATAPGLVRAGAGSWDGSRTPIHPLSLESAYADPELLRDLGARGARFARDLGVDVVVGAETAGVPLAAAVSLAGGLPFAFARKPGYVGHEEHEPRVRGRRWRVGGCCWLTTRSPPGMRWRSSSTSCVARGRRWSGCSPWSTCATSPPR